jgi:hypothetical protein
LKCEKKLEGYSDANWAESREDRKSNSGYLFKLRGGVISWACRKQNCVALSSTEAEYIALCEAAQELSWIRKIFKDFNINLSCGATIHVDNQSCMKLTDNQKFSNRTKHIDTKYHFVRDLVERQEVNLEYISSEENVSDLLTKPLASTRIAYLRELAGLKLKEI